MTETTATTETEAVPSPTETQEAAQTSEVPEPEAAPQPEPAGEPEPTSEVAPFDPYEALERDEMRPVLEQRDKRRERDMRGELDQEYREKTRNWEATQAANTLAGYFGNLFQKLADTDPEGFERSIQSLQQFATPLMNDYKAAVSQAEAKAAAHALYVHMSGALKTRDKDAFEKYVEDPKIGWPDAFKEYVRLASGESLAAKDAEITRLNGIIERQKAEGRTGQGPSTAQGAPGGGGLTKQQLMDMSPEDYAQVSEELKRKAFYGDR